MQTHSITISKTTCNEFVVKDNNLQQLCITRCVYRVYSAGLVFVAVRYARDTWPKHPEVQNDFPRKNANDSVPQQSILTSSIKLSDSCFAARKSDLSYFVGPQALALESLVVNPTVYTVCTVDQQLLKSYGIALSISPYTSLRFLMPYIPGRTCQKCLDARLIINSYKSFNKRFHHQNDRVGSIKYRFYLHATLFFFLKKSYFRNFNS